MPCSSPLSAPASHTYAQSHIHLQRYGIEAGHVRGLIRATMHDRVTKVCLFMCVCVCVCVSACVSWGNFTYL